MTFIFDEVAKLLKNVLVFGALPLIASVVLISWYVYVHYNTHWLVNTVDLHKFEFGILG